MKLGRLLLAFCLFIPGGLNDQTAPSVTLTQAVFWTEQALQPYLVSFPRGAIYPVALRDPRPYFSPEDIIDGRLPSPLVIPTLETRLIRQMEKFTAEGRPYFYAAILQEAIQLDRYSLKEVIEKLDGMAASGKIAKMIHSTSNIMPVYSLPGTSRTHPRGSTALPAIHLKELFDLVTTMNRPVSALFLRFVRGEWNLSDHLASRLDTLFKNGELSRIEKSGKPFYFPSKKDRPVKVVNDKKTEVTNSPKLPPEKIPLDSKAWFLAAKQRQLRIFFSEEITSFIEKFGAKFILEVISQRSNDNKGFLYRYKYQLLHIRHKLGISQENPVDNSTLQDLIHLVLNDDSLMSQLGILSKLSLQHGGQGFLIRHYVELNSPAEDRNQSEAQFNDLVKKHRIVRRVSRHAFRYELTWLGELLLGELGIPHWKTQNSSTSLPPDLPRKTNPASPTARAA